jgi:hypothetical protein
MHAPHVPGCQSGSAHVAQRGPLSRGSDEAQSVQSRRRAVRTPQSTQCAGRSDCAIAAQLFKTDALRFDNIRPLREDATPPGHPLQAHGQQQY